MTKLKRTLKYVFAFIFISGGLMHFIKPEMYLPMMPNYLPSPLLLIYISGLGELGLGLALLIPRFQRLAAWGLIVLLLCVFPANINMAMHPEKFPELSELALWIRLPIQIVLIAWAYWYTKPNRVLISKLY